ncbi:MAG: response regulator transcription factor [Lachnospiraceae bacterium]|nr:response regulator transcription factor [Lachnospiraceae bacterium]
MIQIAIVEDDPAERARIRSCLEFFEKTEDVSFHITEFPTGTAFLGNYRSEFDIVFMDIQMPGMDGMETARALREIDPSVILIFVTNMPQYAVLGYEVSALDFVLKPINKYSFALKVKRAVSRTTKRKDEYIPVKTEGEITSIRIASIRYVDMEDRHVVYHMTEGNYAEAVTLKQACAKINRDYFVYCNRSFLVNLRYVSSVNREIVTVGKDELIISRPQRKAFLSALSDFIGGITV